MASLPLREVVLSPILVRPVREQLEHDRIIRLLQAKYKKKFEAAINPGTEHTTPVGSGSSAWYPDVVLLSPDRHRKLAGIVEVETTESVNHLEAMSQWAAFTRFDVPFHLYVPVGSVDAARRFCTDLKIQADEIWAYQAVGDQMRFTPIQRAVAIAPVTAKTSAPAAARPRAASGSRRVAGEATRPAAKRTDPAPTPARPRANARTAARTGRAAAAGTSRRPSVKAKAAPRRSTTKTAKAKTSRAAKRR